MTTREPGAELPAAARAMETAANAGRPVVPVLKKTCPHIYRQIARDAGCPGLFHLWGRSANVDEFAHQTIVHPGILAAIGSVAGVPMQGRFVHAGLQHTYGYLFSLIETPYGFKRDRWLDTQMEQGFGINESLLGDRPAEGTLLANLTCFLGHIVLNPRRLQPIIERRGAVARGLVGYDYARLERQRIVEEVTLRGGAKPGRKATLYTDLLPYPRLTRGPRGKHLLIYSIQVGDRPTRLITAFPMTAEATAALRAELPANGRGPVRLRYNAYVPGLYGRSPVGKRRLLDEGTPAD